MILKSLHDLYERLANDSSSGITPLKFAPQKVSFHVTLNQDGSIFSISSVVDKSSRKKFRNEIVPEHKIRSGTKILPQFICDKSTYCLGIDPNTGIETWHEKQFNSFKAFHLAA